MESVDSFLYQASRRSLSEVLDSQADLGCCCPHAWILLECICAHANQPGNGDLESVRACALFGTSFVEIPFDYYFQPYEKQYSIQVVKQGIPLDLFDSGIPEPEMTTNDIPGLLSLLHGHDRVWLVYSHDSYTDPMGLIPETLASQMKLTRTREFYGGKVQLYETP